MTRHDPTSDSTSDPTSSRPGRGRRVVALVSALVLVLGLVGVTVAVVVRGDDPGTADESLGSPTLALSRTSNVAGQVLGGAVGGYELRGELPAGEPAGVVITPETSTATEAQVGRLLAALGLDTDPVQVAGGWTAAGRVDGEAAAFALDERAGNVWQYARGEAADCLAVQPGRVPDSSVSCSAPAPGPDSADAAGPGRAELLKQADALLELVGVRPGTGLRAHDAFGTTYLDVPLTVEGLPVVDVTISVGVDDRGIVTASGWLHPEFSTVGEYPLVDATSAFAALLAQPVPAIAPACDEGATCPPAEPQQVTSARLAWLTSQDTAGAAGAAPRTVLVPAWQFEADGFFGPAVVAVDPAHLQTENLR